MAGFRTGIDTYSFHRLLGELRPGEEAPAAVQLANGGVAAIELADFFGPDLIALETCFLEAGADPGALREAAGETELALSWGHPEGLAFGLDPEAEGALGGWLELAAAAGMELVRIVVGGPRLRGAEPVEAQIARTVGPLRRSADRAAALGIGLAIENHGDLTVAELCRLLEATAHPGVGICLDTANVVRLGEDLVAASALAAPWVRMVHLKDVAGEFEDPVAGPRSVPHGTGELPLEEALAELSGPVAAGAPVCVEIAQIGPGDDELELVGCGMRWLAERGGAILPR